MQVDKKLVSKLLLAVLVFSSLVVSGQQLKKVLTNDDVIKMVKEGLPDNVIVSTIQQFPANYDVSPDALIQMKRQGVSSAVLTAVQEAEKVKSSKPTESTASSEPKTQRKNDFVFKLESCQSSGGDSVTCRVLITNKAQERRLSITNASHIVDNLGDEHSAEDMWIGKNGKQLYAFEIAVTNTLIPQIEMTAILKFQNVKPNATSLSILRIACSTEGTSFPVDFRDVSITQKSPPSSIPNVEPQQANQMEMKDDESTRISTDSPTLQQLIEEGEETVKILPKGTTIIYGNAETVYEFSFKYRVKRFSLDVRKRLDLCAGTMRVGKTYLEIRTDSGKSQSGSDCNFNTYRLTKDDIQKLKETFDSHWYDFSPTTDHLYIKFTVVEKNGKDKKKKEFYLYPTEALIKYGTRFCLHFNLSSLNVARYFI